MSSPRPLFEFQKPFEGLHLLVTGAETDLGRVLTGLVLAESFPVAHLHLLFRRTRRGPHAQARFAAFCRKSPAAAPLRAMFGAKPDLALADRVTVHAAAPARDDLGLAADTIAHLKATVGAVIIAARSHRPDSDPRIVLDRELRHPIVIAQLFSKAALLLLSDVDAVSSAGLTPETVIREAEVPRNFDPSIETVRLAQLAMNGSRIGDRAIINDRRRAAFARARALGFASTGGYARAIAEALWLERARTADGPHRMCILRLGRLGPAAEPALDGWCSDVHSLQVLLDLIRLPVKHLPLEPGTPLQLMPVDMAARHVLLTLAAVLRADAPAILHAVPPAATDLRLDRALSLLQLALRRVPSAAAGPAWSQLVRRWVVAVPDPARALADIEAARNMADRMRGGLGPLPSVASAHAPVFAELAAAGTTWLDATGRDLSTRLAAAFRQADQWFVPFRPVFASDRREAVYSRLEIPADTPWAAIAAPIDWLAWFSQAVPAALTRQGRKAARSTSGPSPEAAVAAAAVADMAAVATRAGLRLWSRLRGT